MKNQDDSVALIDQVQRAVNTRQPLTITAGNSKRHLGHATGEQTDSETLNMLSHTGIISYDPTELVVTVRAGTNLNELNKALHDAGQMLPFEPPDFGGSTIGGVLACGLSGPRRPFNGSARDYVLGTRVINGQAQDLSFGGEVMKNVAGYDVSRLQIGAWGTLGVLLDISMKVLPLPESEMTLVSDARPHDTESFASLLRQPIPLSGAMQIGDKRYLRLSGSDSSVQVTARQLGGEPLTDTKSLWDSVANHTHDWFTSSALPAGHTLWRVSVADHAPPLELAGEWLYEWAGALRWLKSDMPAERIYDAVGKAGGHAIRYSQSTDDSPAFQPLSGPMQRLQSRVRDSFDPLRLFNRGRFHPELDTQSDQIAADSVSA